MAGPASSSFPNPPARTGIFRTALRPDTEYVVQVPSGGANNAELKNSAPPAAARNEIIAVSVVMSVGWLVSTSVRSMLRRSIAEPTLPPLAKRGAMGLPGSEHGFPPV